MKKLFILFSMMLCSVLYYTNTFANVIDNSSVYSETTDFYDDGYIVVEIVTNDSNNIASYSTSKSKTATKKISYYTSSNKLLWTVHLSGTFSYNGSSSSCTKASCSISNLDSNWSVKSKSATKSKNTAHAKVTMHQKGGGDLSKELTLTCDKNGKLK